MLAALSAEVILLAVTGAALYFVYRPSDATAWNDIRASAGSVQISHLVRFVHRASAYLAVLSAIGFAVLGAVRPSGPRRWTSPLLGGGLALTTAAALVTGFLLPWDQLALWAVTVGTNFTGFGPLLGNQVRFVLINNDEVSPEVIVTWLAIHATLGGLVAGVLLTAAWTRHRRSARPPISSRQEPLRLPPVPSSARAKSAGNPGR